MGFFDSLIKIPELIEQDRVNRRNEKWARAQMWAQANAHQIEARDLKLAGLSRTLTAGGAGASVSVRPGAEGEPLPWGGMFGDPLKEALDYYSIAQSQAQVELLKTQAEVQRQVGMSQIANLDANSLRTMSLLPSEQALMESNSIHQRAASALALAQRRNIMRNIQINTPLGITEGGSMLQNFEQFIQRNVQDFFDIPAPTGDVDTPQRPRNAPPTNGTSPDYNNPQVGRQAIRETAEIGRSSSEQTAPDLSILGEELF